MGELGGSLSAKKMKVFFFEKLASLVQESSPQ